MTTMAEQQRFSRTGAPRVGVVGAGGLGVHHVRILRDLCDRRDVDIPKSKLRAMYRGERRVDLTAGAGRGAQE